MAMLPFLSTRSSLSRWKSQKKQFRSTLESCLERFQCRKEDEFHFTSPEFVEGIPPFACEFGTQTSINHLLAAADEDGQVVIYNTDITGQKAQVKEWSAHNNAIFDIAWSSTEPRLVTASGDQSAALWDIKTATRLASFKQHKCSLKSVSFRPWDGHVFATGARDGSIMIWDDRSKKKGKGSSQLPVSVISEAHIDQKKTKAQNKRRRKLVPNLPTIDSSHSVSVVLFQKEDTLLSAGSADGIVKVWDLRKLKTSGTKSGTSVSSALHQFPYSGTSKTKRGFSSLALTSTRTELFASCIDSVVYEYDLSGVVDSQPVARYTGHMNSTFFVKAAISPENLFLLSGSSDSHAYIWKIGEPECPPVTLVGHEAEVTSVAWCPKDFTKVVTCSDDNTMRLWKMSASHVADEGANQVVGIARCMKTLQGNKETPEPATEIQSSQTTQSSSDSNRSSPIGEISESPLSPQLSPMSSSTKKRKFSLKEWVTTSPSPSMRVSLASSSKRRKSESLSNIQSPNESHGEVGEGTGNVVSKRKLAEDCVDSKKLKTCAMESNSKSSDSCKVLISNSGESSPRGAVRVHDNTDQISAGSRCDEVVGSDREQRVSCDKSDLDKENLTKEGQRDKMSHSETSSNSNSCPRSPLRDDIPMNKATNSVLPLSANKNVTLCLQSSSKVSEGRCEKEEGGADMQQQNLKECFKEKKVGGLAKGKRRNSISTIDGYFQPLHKICKTKSETQENVSTS